MNDRDMKFVSIVFPKYYGRIDSARVDIKYTSIKIEDKLADYYNEKVSNRKIPSLPTLLLKNRMRKKGKMW